MLKKRASLKKGLLVWWFLVPVVSYMLVWAFSPSQKMKPVMKPEPQYLAKKSLKFNVPYERPDAENMLSALFDDMAGTNPKNSYYPVFGRKQFDEFINRSRSHQLIISLDNVTPFDPNGNGLTGYAWATYIKGQPALKFLIQPIVNDALEDYQAGRPFKPVLKNNMYYFIAHELLHLDQPPSAFLEPQSHEYHIREEMRVWAICDFQIVRPLMAQKTQPLKPDFWDGEFVMKACRDQWQTCAAWRGFIQGRIG